MTKETRMKKLEWVNLKDDFCPKCYGELNMDGETEGEPYTLRCSACGFAITKKRRDEILYDMEKDKRILDEE